MNKTFIVLSFLILSTFASYCQNVYKHFSELNGMEDFNSNTNLLYRISYSYVGQYSYGSDNSIYLLNVVNNKDSIFQNDYYYDGYIGPGWRSVSGYDFWEKNPRKFIVCGSYGGIESSPFVERFDNKNIGFSSFGGGGFIGISRQNDSLVYATFNGSVLCRSINGGVLWDTAGKFNALSLSPYNDKVLFSSENGMLNKTTDGGKTHFIVDTVLTNGYRNSSLYYDKDTNYIYRTSYYYSESNSHYSLVFSNNSGNANSWKVKYTSPLPIYLSIDNAVSGSIYLATGRYIYHSSDFGNTFFLNYTFDRKLVGIYKKPASTKLYAATHNTIYELDGSSITKLKQIPIDPEIFKFDPIDIGNKWYYKTSQSAKGILIKEIVKDTVLANQKTFRQIKQKLVDPVNGYLSYSYERIDSATGDVYSWRNDSTEYIIDNLNHNPGDTINAARFIGAGTTIFDSLKSILLFGTPTDTRVYTNGGPLVNAHYYLSKGFGLSYLLKGLEALLITNELKGAVIKGIIYGDTSTVVGITDKYPNQPIEFRLSQNYPNPFNPATTINYFLPKGGQVKLTVYNALGSKVATIVNEFKPAGNYSIKFNAANLASGIYFYRIESGQFSQNKKMILIK